MSRPDDVTRSVATTADRGVVRVPSRARFVDLVTSLPTWGAILTIFVASRALSTFWLALVYPLAARAQPANAIKTGDGSFMTFLTSWDGQWYDEISVHGYPTTLPVDAAGHVVQNVWAFLPIFPWTIRMLTASTGMPFEIGAPAVATLSGLVAAFLLHALLRERTTPNAAMWGVLFFCIGPLSFLLEVGYAESLFLALVFGALLAMQRRNYVALTALGVVAGFTRPGALAIPLALAVVAIVRIVRERESFPVRERVQVVLSGVTMGVAGVAWSPIAGLVTHHPGAYLETEMSWWVAFVGRVTFVPLSPWFIASGIWLGVGGIFLVIAMILGYAAWLWRRSTREIGLESLAFSGAYALYLLAVSIPMASTPRLIMPLAPLVASRELVQRPWMRWVMVIGALVGQPVCIAVLWLLGPP